MRLSKKERELLLDLAKYKQVDAYFRQYASLSLKGLVDISTSEIGSMFGQRGYKTIRITDKGLSLASEIVGKPNP